MPVASSGLFTPAPAPSLSNIFRALSRSAQRGVRQRVALRPTLQQNTDPYRYAQLIVAGVEYADACRELGIKPRTAERYRQELRAEGAAYFGRSVKYEFVALYVLCPEWREIVDRDSTVIPS